MSKYKYPTIEVFDREIRLHNMASQFEAVGRIRLWFEPERVRQIRESMMVEASQELPIAGHVTLHGNGDIEAVDCTSIYQAIGFLLTKAQLTNHTLSQILAQVAASPKMAGCIVMNHGGEVSFRGFFDAYERLGFLAVRCSPDEMKRQITKTFAMAATKFRRPETVTTWQIVKQAKEDIEAVIE